MRLKFAHGLQMREGGDAMKRDAINRVSTEDDLRVLFARIANPRERGVKIPKFLQLFFYKFKFDCIGFFVDIYKIQTRG